MIGIEKVLGDDGRDRVEDVVALCPLRPDGTYWVTNCTPAPPG